MMDSMEKVVQNSKFFVIMIIIAFLIDPGAGLTCLRCESVISPRHCHQIDICEDNEVCVVEKYQNTLHEDLYNVGCKPKSLCFNATTNDVSQYSHGKSVKSTRSSCTQCCNSDLCNSAGCNSQGLPSNRGPLCYSCHQSRSVLTCDSIAVCDADEVCHVEISEEFGERFYTTSCVYHKLCQSNTGNNVFGKRNMEMDSLKVLCEKCCNEDLCNNECGTPLQSYMTSATTAHMTSPTTINAGTTQFNSAGNKGNVFWLSFPENSQTQITNDFHLILYISARTESEETVKVYNNSGFATYTFNKSLTIEIDRHNQLFRNIIEQKGIKVVSDRAVYLVGYSTFSLFSSAAFNVIPFGNLGMSYIVMSYPPAVGYISFVSILAVHPDTTIRVTLNTSGSYTFNGRQYSTNDTFEIYLKEFHTFQVSHTQDLTGTLIKSDKPVAVQSGCNNALPKPIDFNHYSVFLPPIPKLGTSFIMPVFLSSSGTSMRVTPVSKLTTVNVSAGSKTTRYQLTGTLELNLPVSKSAVITCSTPCLVAAYSFSNVSGSTWDLMTLVPSISQYSRNVTFITPHDTYLNYSHYISITIKSSEVGSLMVDGKSIFSYNLVSDTVSLHGESWSVLSLKIKRGQHSISSFEDIYYGVVAYGLRLSSAYAFPVDMKID